MATNKIVLFALLAIVSACVASPIGSRPFLGIPIFVYDPTGLDLVPDSDDDVSDPTRNAFVVRLGEPTDTLEPLALAKRSADQSSDLEDLETAAGTNALRPLFVYRQQVAYRQRVRDAIRRGNRF